MVPKGWSHTTLGKVMAFKNGLNFTKTDVGEEIKIVGVADFKDLSELRSTERLDSVNVASHIKDDELLTDGDLLFVRSNGNKDLIGRCLFFPEVKERLSFSGFTIRGRADKKNVLPQYMAFVARSSFFKSQISQYGGGTNISNLSQQILNDIALSLPPLYEQKKIAKILSTWDKAITTTEQLLANSQQQKKALMQQLLTGKKRLLDNNGVRFSGEWRKLSVRNSSTCITKGTTPSTNGFEFQDQGIPFIKVECIGDNGVIDTSKVAYIDEDCHLAFKRSQLKSGDILFSIAGALGRVALVPDYLMRANTNQAVCLIRLDADILDRRYCYYFLQSERIKREILAETAQAAQPNLSLKNVGDFEVTAPAMEEQQKIASVLFAADQEVESLQQELAALKREKTALMQQLLTGKRRVKID